MVDLADKKKDGPEDEVGRLRERVSKLTAELEDIDRDHARACDSFGTALNLLANLNRDALDQATAEAVDGLAAASGASPLEPVELATAVEALKQAIIRDPSASAAKAGARAASGEAARHVSLALLQGLRVGDQGFDAHLDQTIAEINSAMEQRKVRPAMILVVDLLDRFREILDRGRQKAETALKEIMFELLQTEDELARAFRAANSNLQATGDNFNQKMNASMTEMVKDVTGATDLGALKSAALDRIRTLRSAVKERQAEDQQQIEVTEKELGRIRETLDTTRARMAEVERIRERLREQAMTDPMTGIWNKRALVERVEEALAAEAQWPLCLIVFDIDHFKGVNDNYGHQAGDRALKAIATSSGGALRESDVLFRYAGDEFVILLPNTNLDDAKLAAERVRVAAEKIKFTFGGKGELRITITLGLSQAKPGDSYQILFERADQALLLAKQAGRNRVGVG